MSLKRKESETVGYVCLICKEEQLFASIGSCDHTNVCLFCCMRLRILYDDTKCSVCNTKLSYVFITEIENNTFPSFKELDLKKDEFYKDEQFSSNGIYYESFSAKEHALKLRNFICPIKSCKTQAFETLQNLCNHLNYTHKRNFCTICLKDGKKFLSEHNFYTNEKLREHQEYGEYSNEGVILSPIHPFCQHLNEFHISCQICKNKKSLIFYNNVQDLTEHFQYAHQVCPYEECIKDVFVVFQNEEELNAHLILKHKCKDSKKISDFIFNRNKRTEENNLLNPFKNENHKQFNFTLFSKELKEKIDTYAKNQIDMYKLQSTSNKHDKNQSSYDYNKGYDPYFNNANNPTNFNQDEVYDPWQGGGKAGKMKKGKKDKFNQDPNYNNTNYYNNNYDNYKNYDGYNNNYDYNQNYNNYENNYNYGNKYNQGYNNSSSGNYNSSSNNYNNNNNYNNYEFSGQNLETRTTLTKQNYSENIPSVLAVSQTQLNKKMSHLSLIDNFFTYTKEYISNKIKVENPEIRHFILPREKLYQMIVIIDKLDFQNLTELQYIPNFGISLEDYCSLKNLSKIGNFDKNEVYTIYDNLEINQLLYLYKYFHISLTKIKNLFYRLGKINNVTILKEVDQIQENLYTDFVIIDKKKKKLKLNNEIFADYDPVKDKDLNIGNKESTHSSNLKEKLGFNKNKTTNNEVPINIKKKAQFDNLEDFPELVPENKSTIVQKPLKFNNQNKKYGKNIPGFTVTTTRSNNNNSTNKNLEKRSVFKNVEENFPSFTQLDNTNNQTNTTSNTNTNKNNSSVMAAVSTATPTTNKHTSNKTSEKKSVFENIEENFPSFTESSSVVPKQTLNINNQVNQKNNNLNNNTNAPKVINNTNNTSNDLFLNDFPVMKAQKGKGKKKNKQNFQYKDNKQADMFEIDDSEENYEEKVVEKINKSDKDDKENKDSSKLIENFNKFNSLDFFVKKENSQEENKTVEKSNNIKGLFGESADITTEKGKKTNKFTEYKEPEANNLKSYLKNPNPTSNKDASKSNAAKIVDKLGKKTVFGKSNFDMDEAFPELK